MVERMTVGEKRLEYLDLANKAYASGDYDASQKCIDSFLSTVRDGSTIATQIKTEFDKIEKKRVDTWEQLMKDTEDLDSWTRSALRYDNQTALVVEVLKDKINICWQIAMEQSAFND